MCKCTPNHFYTHTYPSPKQTYSCVNSPTFCLKAYTNSIAYTACKKETMNSLNRTKYIMKIFCNYSLPNKKVSEFSNATTRKMIVQEKESIVRLRS